MINLYYFHIPNTILYYLLLQYYILLTVEENVLQIDVNDNPKMYCATNLPSQIKIIVVLSNIIL